MKRKKARHRMPARPEVGIGREADATEASPLPVSDATWPYGWGSDSTLPKPIKQVQGSSQLFSRRL